MMALLRRYYPEDTRSWPTAIEKVHSTTYMEIQKIVHKFIDDRHNGSITPVQFDDIYFEALKRKAP